MPFDPHAPAFERSECSRELRPFVDEAGRLRAWPSRQKVQREAIARLAALFEPGREYAEREVNELLRRWHTFEDWALLRRMLFDWRLVEREPDGSRYRRRLDEPPAPESPGN